jgi:outer membrane biosynthesis protein TonB
MDSYTITIAPNDDSGNSTTLVVDTSGDQVRITDVHLHATAGLAGGTMPTVDFGLLLRAVGTEPAGPPSIDAAPADPPAPAETAAPSADVAEPAPGDIDEPGPVPAPRRPRAKRTKAVPPVAEPKRSRRRRTPDEAPEPAAGARRRRAAAAPATSAPRKKAAAAKAAAQTAGGRAYRRMPEDFRDVYGQTSSPAALAEHYGVPRHTAQGWIRRVKAENAS